ncbi:hypothetical protein GCM10011575_41770 [Microlunatus endophyticus]|uniref:Secretory lipase n=1 Tax=Microlunatus endophyticus TaxID=1716077 RepID=A0A917W8J8_9ACTN|nr:hypothetical protein GCM10011575_41770 [Microlunatus endophyticus]
MGAVVIVRPTTSLDTLAWIIGAGLILAGAIRLLEHRKGSGSGMASAGLGLVVAVIAGLVVWWLPGLTVRLLAVFVGAGIVVSGGLRLVDGFRNRGSVGARSRLILFGMAEIVFGVLALVWPDITLLFVAVLFGARLIMAGLAGLWDVFFPDEAHHLPARPATGSGRMRRVARVIGPFVAVALAAGGVGASETLRRGAPAIDAFYTAPREVPSQPGQLIRFDPFTRGVPADAVGWRILYTTTRGDGSAAIASGLVVVPRRSGGGWPVIDWAHGTTGYAAACAPSLATRPFESGALFILGQVIDNGWALVATDYIGLGTAGPHPYLIGPDSAHAVLDAVRAARQLTQAHLGQQTVVWGHSQGGGAALWTGAVARQYAPGLNIQGVAALAPASNLPALVDNLPTITGGSIFASYVMAAYAAVYPDISINSYIRPGVKTVLTEMAKRCLAEPSALVSVLHALALTKDPEIFRRDPNTGALGKHLAANVPPATIPMSLLIAQGGSDPLVLPATQSGYVDSLCAAGQAVDYRTYAGLDHVGLVEAESPLVPDLLDWTHDRFAGQPTSAGCTLTQR